MPLGRDMDRVEKVGWTLSLFWLIVAIVSGVGEYRGWWGLIGEIGLTVGTLASVLFGLGSYLYGAERSQVERVHEAVLSNGDTLESVDVKLDKLDKLDAIEDAISGEEGMVRELDVIQIELDRQTGVLGQQVEILKQIRDA